MALLTLEEVAAFVDGRIADHDEHIAKAIGAALRHHAARPPIERALLEVAYGTVMDVSTQQVSVALDGDVDVTVQMFSVSHVSIGERVAVLLVPPSSGLVLCSLSGVADSLTLQTVTAQTGDALDVLSPDNGSGKTQLCVIFATGAVQVLATQP